MVKAEDITDVIFRVFKGGQVIAFMPGLVSASPGSHYCDSYMHIGQHGPAFVGLVSETRLATSEELAPLHAELLSLGYNVRIMRRFTAKHEAMRNAQLNRGPAKGSALLPVGA